MSIGEAARGGSGEDSEREGRRASRIRLFGAAWARDSVRGGGGGRAAGFLVVVVVVLWFADALVVSSSSEEEEDTSSMSSMLLARVKPVVTAFRIALDGTPPRDAAGPALLDPAMVCRFGVGFVRLVLVVPLLDPSLFLDVAAGESEATRAGGLNAFFEA